MTDWAGTAVVVGGLLVAVWCLIAGARNRNLGLAGLVGLALVELLALVHVGYAIAGLVRGHHPHEYATFVLYLVTFALLLPFGLLLARMEPTRWGSVIVGVACLVEASLIERLNQLWGGSA